MTDYTKTTNFGQKDNYASGNPLKVIKGAEFDTEFDNLAVHIATKSNKASPTFTGTVTAPTVTVTGTLTAGTIDGGTY